MREGVQQLEAQGVQPITIVANEPFWVCTLPGGSSAVPFPVLTDAVSTVSATYGVAFQSHLWNGWASRQTWFVIDRDGIIRQARDEPLDVLEVLEDLRQKRALIEALGMRSAAVREAAGRVLKPDGLEFEAATAVLVKSLRAEDPDVRAGAAAGLYWIAAHAESTLPALVDALRDPDPRVRKSAAQTLAVLGPRAQAARVPLLAALQDQHEGVRRAVMDALRRIDPEGAGEASAR